ncbi:DUF1192 domain-containing protein [Hansschlegelia sp. KR7-227]|uniref:DUF1192 domain-containing protein n=1 Tax=Hansschlegelia sp. KR7-227 TaxID=3400914 RepID=UPI003C00FAF0
MPAFEDDLAPLRKPVHEIGQDLSRISVAELGDRIELLRDEIVRLQQEIARKEAQRSAADQVFRS